MPDAMPTKQEDRGAEDLPPGSVSASVGWRVHLARSEPMRASVVVAFAAVAGLMGMSLFHSPVYGVIGAAVVLFSCSEFLLPISYRLTDEKASSRYGLTVVEIRWSDVKRVLRDGVTLRLSPLSRASRLDSFRGVVLRPGPDDSHCSQERLMSIIRERAPGARIDE